MAQMPGQAQGFQFAPQQAAGTPAAMVDNFTQIEDLPTLIAMQQRNPSIPLLAHIDEVRKKLQAKQAVANNLAMRQAQQQSPQTLNDQILAGAEQVAGMAPVRRMAAGGIVALQRGGSSIAEPTYENPDFDEEGRPRGVTEKNKIIERNRLRQQAYERAKQGAPRSLTDIRPMIPLMPIEAIQRLNEFPPLGRGMAAEAAAPYPEPVGVREGRRVTSDTGANTTTRNRGVDTTVEKPRQERRQEPPPATAAATSDPLFDAYTAVANAYRLPVTTPEVQEQRKKVADIQELITKQSFDDATRARNELDRELARREGRLNKPFLEGDMLPLLASFLSAKKGEFFPSLAKGLAAVSTEEEKARKDLAQYRATEGDRVRQINDLYRKMQLENARYNNALAEGDLKTAREAQEKLAEATFKYKVQSEELAVKKIAAQAEATSAGARQALANAQLSALPDKRALAEAGLLEKRMKSYEGIQYAQLAAAKAKLMENPLANKEQLANINAELNRLERLMDAKYGGIASVAPSSSGSSSTANLDAAAEAIMKKGP